MKPVAAILFSMILAMACHNPPPKHDPEMLPGSVVIEKVSGERPESEHHMARIFNSAGKSYGLVVLRTVTGE